MTIPLRFDVLTDHQTAVARTYLAARAAERHHLVVYLSGAHAYGFPSPDSDLDLKAVHIAPTGRLVAVSRRGCRLHSRHSVPHLSPGRHRRRTSPVRGE